VCVCVCVQVSVHELADESCHVLVMKGAPECIVERCSTILVNGVEHELDDEWKQHINDAYLEMAGLCRYVPHPQSNI